MAQKIQRTGVAELMQAVDRHARSSRYCVNAVADLGAKQLGAAADDEQRLFALHAGSLKLIMPSRQVRFDAPRI